MNRLGWFLFSLFFAVGVFVFWSTELRHDRPPPARPLSKAAPARAAALRIPVAGVAPAGLVDSWDQPRGDGARVHQAIDIPAPMGTGVVAAMPGRVEKLFESRDGGTTAYVRSDDGKWQAYYAHLSGYALGLAEGEHLAAGQPIGFVGDTGNAGAGNTHLHFALNRMVPDARWYQGEPVNPYPYLAGRDLAGQRAAR